MSSIRLSEIQERMDFILNRRSYYFDQWLLGRCNPRNGSVDLTLGEESNRMHREYQKLFYEKSVILRELEGPFYG